MIDGCLRFSVCAIVSLDIATYSRDRMHARGKRQQFRDNVCARRTRFCHTGIFHFTFHVGRLRPPRATRMHVLVHYIKFIAGAARIFFSSLALELAPRSIFHYNVVAAWVRLCRRCMRCVQTASKFHYDVTQCAPQLFMQIVHLVMLGAKHSLCMRHDEARFRSADRAEIQCW